MDTEKTLDLNKPLFSYSRYERNEYGYGDDFIHRDGDGVDVRKPGIGIFQHLLRHRQQRAAVRQAAALLALGNEHSIAAQGDRRRLGRGLQCEDQHDVPLPSVIVMRRVVGPSFSNRTTTSSP